MRFLRSFGRFWFDFIVGDDWRIAAGVTTVLAGAAALVGAGAAGAVAPVAAAGLVGVLALSLLRSER